MNYTKRKSKTLCSVSRCKSLSYVDKSGYNYKICHKHKHQKFKEDKPISYAYRTLKDNARRRKVNFKLTLEQFTKFCEQTNYLTLKGRTRNDMTIDRINPKIGYIFDNIQILTREYNSRKKWIDDRLFEKYGHIKTDSTKDNPFENNDFTIDEI